MKKIALILAVALLSMAFLTGCEELDIIVDTLENGANINSGGENDQSQEPEVLPTFEELAAINSYDEIFKIHENMYFKNVACRVEEYRICKRFIRFTIIRTRMPIRLWTSYVIIRTIVHSRVNFK